MNKLVKKTLSIFMSVAILGSIIGSLYVEPVYAAKSENENKKSETPVVEVQYETGSQNNAKSRRDDTEAIRTEDDGSYDVVIPGKTLDENGQIVVEDAVETEEEQWEEIHIKNMDDFKQFAKNCSLDTWSRNKNVYLDNDIIIAGSEYISVPTFGGHFYGRNYTISGYTMYDARSYTGLFDFVQEGALIESVVVKANVKANGKQMVTGGLVGENHGEIRNCVFDGNVSGQNYVGGIAGYNDLTGNILNCRSIGSISGAYYTGGIVGENVGNISSSINEANVNTVIVDRASSIQDIDLASYADGILSKLTGNAEEKQKSESILDTGSVDSGGIAGLSIGVIQFCENIGEVGYEHVGYNVGGIVGRHSGYVHGCKNNGIVRGRKDVGGIAGQAEPYVVVDFTEDTISKLTENIDKLHDVIDDTLSDAGINSDTISSRLSIVKEFTDRALSETSVLSEKTIDWTNGMVGAGNELMSRAQYIMNETSKDEGPIASSNKALSDVKSAASDLDKAMSDMNISEYMSDIEKSEYNNAKERLEYLTKHQSENLTKVTNADRNRLYYKYSRDESKEYFETSSDIQPFDSDGNVVSVSDEMISDWENNIDAWAKIITWKHADETIHSSECSKGDSDLSKDVENQIKDDSSQIEEISNTFTAKSYVAEKPDGGGYTWREDNYYQNSPTDYTSNATEKKLVDKEMEINAQTMFDKVSPYLGEAYSNTGSDAKDAAGELKKAAGNMQNAGERTKSIFSEIAGKGQISMPSLGDDYRNASSALNAALQGMSDNMGALNDEMSDSSDVMISDMGKVNDQFNVIMQLYADAIDGVLDGDYGETIEDSSMEVAEICVDATVADCENYGKVEGDIDVSGVTGAMGIEYDFDLESDITKSKDSKLNSTYQSKCVLRANKNYAHVIAQKSYVGGICGLQEIGTILRCENYGKIKSNSSDYVGGIAGDSLSYIQKSVAKCFLYGKNYIGGIAGHGCNILNCYAMIDIDENQADSFYGSIAGSVTDDGKVHYNYFVSDKFAGIDRISFSGVAEPIDYKTFISMDTTPRECLKMYAVFYIDDIETDRIETVYGGTITKDQFPVYVKDDGTYCKWNKDDLNEMSFDVEVEGEYSRYITTLASDQLRVNDQSAILVDGRFKDGDKLQSTLWDVNSLPLEGALEHWELNIPSGINDSHLIRYIAPDGIDNETAIYINNAGRWDLVKTGTFGAYKTFEVTSPHVEIAVLEIKKSHTKEIIIAVISVIILLSLILIIISIVKRKKREALVQNRNDDKKKESGTSAEKQSVGVNKTTDNSELEDATDEDVEIINLDD